MARKPNAETTALKQRKKAPGRPFEKGQSGNPAGRPKGSRNKLGEEFISALQADFEEHGQEAIKQARAESPLGYVKVIASILPKEVKVSTSQDLTDEQLDERIRQLASILEIGTDGASVGTEAPSRPH